MEQLGDLDASDITAITKEGLIKIEAEDGEDVYVSLNVDSDSESDTDLETHEIHPESTVAGNMLSHEVSRPDSTPTNHLVEDSFRNTLDPTSGCDLTHELDIKTEDDVSVYLDTDECDVCPQFEISTQPSVGPGQLTENAVTKAISTTKPNVSVKKKNVQSKLCKSNSSFVGETTSTNFKLYDKSGADIKILLNEFLTHQFSLNARQHVSEVSSMTTNQLQTEMEEMKAQLDLLEAASDIVCQHNIYVNTITNDEDTNLQKMFEERVEKTHSDCMVELPNEERIPNADGVFTGSKAETNHKRTTREAIKVNSSNSQAAQVEKRPATVTSSNTLSKKPRILTMHDSSGQSSIDVKNNSGVQGSQVVTSHSNTTNPNSKLLQAHPLLKSALNGKISYVQSHEGCGMIYKLQDILHSQTPLSKTKEKGQTLDINHCVVSPDHTSSAALHCADKPQKIYSVHLQTSDAAGMKISNKVQYKAKADLQKGHETTETSSNTLKANRVYLCVCKNGEKVVLKGCSRNENEIKKLFDTVDEKKASGKLTKSNDDNSKDHSYSSQQISCVGTSNFSIKEKSLVPEQLHNDTRLNQSPVVLLRKNPFIDRLATKSKIQFIRLIGHKQENGLSRSQFPLMKKPKKWFACAKCSAGYKSMQSLRIHYKAAHLS